MRRLGPLLACVLGVSSAHAQVQQAPAVVSLPDAQVQQHPAESPLLMTTLEFRFPTQNNRSLRDVRTYIDRFENGLAGKRVVFNFVERTDTAIPTAAYPTPPPGYRQPPAGHERLYPPPEG